MTTYAVCGNCEGTLKRKAGHFICQKCGCQDFIKLPTKAKRSYR